MKRENLSDIRRNNQTALIGHSIEAVIIVLIYLICLIRGDRGLAYTMMMIAVTLIPVFLGNFYFLRDGETSMVKHTVGIGFAVTYSIMTMTTVNAIIYVMAIPMILLISVFNDAKYSAEINTGSIILNLIMTIGGACTGQFGYQGIDFAMIQVITVILVAAYSIYVARTSNANNQQKLDHIREEQLNSEQLSDSLSVLYQKLQTGIADIYEKVDQLNVSSGETKNAMKDVSTGTSETASAVQNQLLQTEEIQHKVDLVSDASQQISSNMEQTMEVLNNANNEVKLLVSQAEESVKAGVSISSKLEVLDQYVKEMHSIVDLIGGIASQTTLLALNASIEAARAGEVGRGFAVVASEITKMAARTKDATANITNLIHNTSNAISDVVTIVREMIAAINEEKQSTEKTALSFSHIQENTLLVQKNTENLSNDVRELKAANEQIVDSIETISAIFEEVAAHAYQTMDAQESNTVVLNQIRDRMQSLVELTAKQN